MLAETVSDRIVVEADADTVMDIIVDYEAYPDWQPEFRAVEVLETDADGWGTRVRFTVDAGMFRATYVLRYLYADAAVEWHLESSEQLRELDGAYLLSPVDTERTDVEYRLLVTPAVPMPSLLRRQAAKRIVDGALRGLKERVEGRR